MQFLMTGSVTDKLSSPVFLYLQWYYESGISYRFTVDEVPETQEKITDLETRENDIWHGEQVPGETTASRV